MPDYEHFSVEDFVRDPFFQQWVIQPRPEHTSFWKKWLSDHPQKQGIVNQAREIIHKLELSSDLDNNTDFITVWETAYENIKSSESISQPSPTRHSKYPNRWKPINVGIAAIVTIAVLSVFAYLEFSISSSDTIYSTRFGETQEIVLPDSSRVILNANSTLKYDHQWQDTDDSEQNRSVWLEGEAFFQVAKQNSDDSQPIQFNVHTQDLVISVLGTQFNVNQRNSDIKVVLSEGQVHLQNSSKTVDLTMSPGELVKYSSQTHQTSQTKVNTLNYTAWKENQYVFEDVALAEIGSLIENIYGKRVLIKTTSLGERKITATIPTTELSVLLAIIKETMGITIIQSDDQIILQEP